MRWNPCNQISNKKVIFQLDQSRSQMAQAHLVIGLYVRPVWIPTKIGDGYSRHVFWPWGNLLPFISFCSAHMPKVHPQLPSFHQTVNKQKQPTIGGPRIQIFCWDYSSYKYLWVGLLLTFASPVTHWFLPPNIYANFHPHENNHQLETPTDRMKTHHFFELILSQALHPKKCSSLQDIICNDTGRRFYGRVTRSPWFLNHPKRNIASPKIGFAGPWWSMNLSRIRHLHASQNIDTL